MGKGVSKTRVCAYVMKFSSGFMGELIYFFLGGGRKDNERGRECEREGM